VIVPVPAFAPLPIGTFAAVYVPSLDVVTVIGDDEPAAATSTCVLPMPLLSEARPTFPVTVPVVAVPEQVTAKFTVADPPAVTVAVCEAGAVHPDERLLSVRVFDPTATLLIV
jgi:hypothetical protein